MFCLYRWLNTIARLLVLRRQRIVYSERGAVSVFLIFVIMVVFTLMSVLIDYARIAALEWRTEAAAQTAARSVMSAYDPEVQQRYGLFAYGQTDPTHIVEVVLNNHIPHTDEDTFSWVNMEIRSHETEVLRPLGRLEEFEHQVQEVMKYKAPVQIAYELIGKLKPLSGAMKEAVQATELLHSIKRDVDERNDELEQVLKLQKQARDTAADAGAKQLLTQNNQLGLSDRPIGPVTTASDIVSQYNDYLDKLADSEVIEKTGHKKYQQLISRFEIEARRLAQLLERKVSAASEQQTESLKEAKQTLNRVYDKNVLIRDRIRQVRATSQGQGYDQVQQSSTGQTVSNEDERTVIRKFKESIDSLVLEDGFFVRYEAELHTQAQQFASIAHEVNLFQKLVNSIPEKGSKVDLQDSVTNMWNLWTVYEQDYIRSSGNLIQEKEKEVRQITGSDSQRRRLDKETKQELGKVSDLLGSLRKINAKLKEHQAVFDEVKQKADQIKLFNKREHHADLQVGGVESDPTEQVAASMDGITALYSNLGSMVNGARDRLFRNEYAFLYFNSYDPTKLKSLLHESQPSHELLQSLSINNQELEYVMYGWADPAANLAAAYGEIFSLRLAVRTMEGIVQSAHMVHPMVILASAVLYGVRMAFQDMIALMTKNEVPLSAYAPMVNLSYSDFLRLFMMLHGDKEQMSIRMLALIHNNTDLDPIVRGTYGQTDLKARMKLWFLPGVIKLLGESGLIGGQIADGYYEATRRSVFAY